MSEPRTPQVPMVDQNGQPFYPLTQYNQIVMPGGGRWDGETSSPVELDATLKEAGKAADAGAVGMALNELNQAKNEKADKAGWTAGKNVVTDADGNLVTEDKPTIPTIPSALPNPFAVTINGQSYDGSKEVEMTVSGLPDGGTTGQVLSKKSDANQDVEWKELQTDSGATEWKLLGSATNVEGGRQISEILPDEYKELIVKFNDSASPAYLNLTIYIIRAMVTHSNTNAFRTGYYASASEYAEATIEVNLGGVVTFGEYYRKGTKYTDGSVTATVWYR